MGWYMKNLLKKILENDNFDKCTSLSKVIN